MWTLIPLGSLTDSVTYQLLACLGLDFLTCEMWEFTEILHHLAGVAAETMRVNACQGHGKHSAHVNLSQLLVKSRFCTKITSASSAPSPRCSSAQGASETEKPLTLSGM